MSENGTVLTLQVVDLVIGGVGIAVVVFFGCYTYYQYKLMRKWFDQEKTIFKQQQVLFEKQQEELKIQEQMGEWEMMGLSQHENSGGMGGAMLMKKDVGKDDISRRALSRMFFLGWVKDRGNYYLIHNKAK